MQASTLRTLVLLSTLAAPASAAPLRGDIESDPTAYALSGNSIHAGIGYDHLRLDVGSFAMSVPRFVHGDDGFDVAFEGYGLKLHAYRRADQLGPFAGISASATRLHVRRRGTDLSVDDRRLITSVELGYRIGLPAGFYITPWIGLGYSWGADAVMLGGKTFEGSPLSVFPAVHLGYRFR